MALILRALVECKDAEVTKVMLECLKTMASLQDTHPGTICYNFAHPDPEGRPNYLEFVEVYANQANFIGHASDPKFTECYIKAFTKDNFTSVTYGYGPGIEGKTKDACAAALQNFKGPVTDTAGFIIGSKPFDKTSSLADDGGILLVGELRAKEGKGKEVLELISKLSAEANDGVIVCLGSINDPEKQPDVVDVIQLCTTNSHLLAHFCSDRAKEVLKSIYEASTTITWIGYGTVLPTTSEKLSEVGVKVEAKKTDEGYVLHPQADPNGK